MPRAQYIAAGFSTDCENLILSFSETESFKFEDFSKIWREKQFSLIFNGRENETELREFINESFQIALKFLCSSFSFQKKTGVLFILYSLYLKQPLDPKVNIRITLDQWHEMLKLLNMALHVKYLDICYVIKRLQILNAFSFCAHSKMLGPRCSVVGESELEASSSQLNPLFAPLKSFLEEGFQEQLSTLHDYYQDLKENQDCPSVRDLKMVNENIVLDFSKNIKDLHLSYFNQGVGDDEEEKKVSQSIGERRIQIRERQYMSKPNVSRSRRHRNVEGDTSASDRDTTKRRSSRSRRGSRTDGSEGYSSGSHHSQKKRKKRVKKQKCSSRKSFHESEDSN